MQDGAELRRPGQELLVQRRAPPAGDEHLEIVEPAGHPRVVEAVDDQVGVAVGELTEALPERRREQHRPVLRGEGEQRHRAIGHGRYSDPGSGIESAIYARTRVPQPSTA
jgi:hypothetical protein